MSEQLKAERYRQTLQAITSLCENETDEIAMMATIVCELHQRMEGFHWTGFYRVTAPKLLKVGPYQGGHGCLSITFERGVCGRAASMAETQIVDDVNQLPYHIACSSSTQSEIVVPVFDRHGNVKAVLDIDSDNLAQFDATDKFFLEGIVSLLTPTFTNLNE